MSESATTQTIQQLIDENRVVLFMKGTRHFPQCGFSATVAQILDDLLPEYHTVNVLKDPEIREGIKDFSNWPTIPQLYVDGNFVGGCDIVREMYVAGELHALMGVKNEAKVPTITLTEAAQKAISEATAEEEGSLRLTVSPRFEYELSVDEERDADLVIDAGGIQVLVDRMSAKRADGVCIDFSEAGGGFRIDNPNEPPKVRELRPAELKKLLDGEDAPTLVDVRPAEERALAAIAGALPLDDAAETLAALDRDKPIAFYCHHGMRSRAAAERFLADGFRKVYNLGGGIEAWSRDVDPDVPRY